MGNVFAPPQIVSPLFSQPNAGINVLAIHACINSAISNSVQQAFLLAYIRCTLLYSSASQMPDMQNMHSLHPPLGPTSTATDLIPGSRFHLDFGFMRASSNTFLKTKTGTCVVQSHDGFTSYLIIADAVTCYTWVFLTVVSKEPPLQLVTKFLQTHGLVTTGYWLCCPCQPRR